MYEGSVPAHGACRVCHRDHARLVEVDGVYGHLTCFHGVLQRSFRVQGREDVA